MGEGSGSRREEAEVRVSYLHLQGIQLEGWRGTDCGGGGLAHLVPSSWGLGWGWGNCILSKSQVTLMLLAGALAWKPLGHGVMALVTPAIEGG